MRLHRSIPSAFLAFLAAFALSQGAPPTTPPTQGQTPSNNGTMSRADKDDVLKALSDIIANRAFVPGVDMSKWQEHLDKQKEDLDKAERDTDFSRAINRALRSFGVSHIRLLTPRNAEARERTSIVSIGVMARSENNTLVVTMVMPQSPAEAAGMKVGDVIMTVDGKAPENTQSLGGDEGSEVTLKVKSGEAEKEIKVKRARVSTARPETLTWIGDDTAVIKIWTFSRGYGRDNIEKLFREAEDKKAKYLVLDLRSNGGGSTANLQHLLSLFIAPDTAVGTFVGKQTVRNYEKEHTPSTDPIVIAAASDTKYKTRKLSIPPFSGKVAVLVNRGSASASEICASALREVLGATVVGQKSAGAVLASIFGRLPHGFQIQYPVSDYVTIKGVRLEGNPIMPDVEATGSTGEDGKDPVVEKAIEKLKG